MRPLIVTLSSVPTRFDKIAPVLETLTAQTADIEAINLYIPQNYQRFPDWDGTLPNVPDGITIIRTEDDLGPGTKVLPAAREYGDRDVDILFCDDDHLYAPSWAQSFVDLRQRRPHDVLAQGGWQAVEYANSPTVRDLQPRAQRRWRITDLEFQLRYFWQDIRAGARRRELTGPPRRVFKRSGFVDVFEGYAGVMVTPDMFDQAFFDIPLALWRVDDVWLSGMLTLRGHAIWLEGNIYDPQQAEAERHAPLARAAVGGDERHDQNRLGVEYFQDTHGIWL